MLSVLSFHIFLLSWPELILKCFFFKAFFSLPFLVWFVNLFFLRFAPAASYLIHQSEPSVKRKGKIVIANSIELKASFLLLPFACLLFILPFQQQFQVCLCVSRHPCFCPEAFFLSINRWVILSTIDVVATEHFFLDSYNNMGKVLIFQI